MLSAAALAVGLFVLYFAVYRVRRFDMPVGFDAPWYVWRGEYVGELGAGDLGTNERPGHALLAAIVTAVSGLSHLELAVVLPLVLVPVFALASGALWRGAFGRRGWGWVAAAAVAGTLLGATRLVGENVANLMNLALVVTAMLPLVTWVATGSSRALAASTALVVAAGLAHWLFLGVAGAAVLLWAAARLVGTDVTARRKTGRAAVAVLAAAAAMTAIVVLVLDAPFSTFEIREDPGRFLPKLRTDLGRLLLPLTVPVAAVGASVLARWTRLPRRSVTYGPDSGSPPLRRLLLSWAIVCLGGVLVGVLTRRLPPHRFLALFVALPLAAAVTAAVVAAIRWISLRARGAGVAAAVGLLAIMSIPGVLAWYRGGPGVWIDRDAVAEADVVDRFARSLPAGTPLVFVLEPRGAAGAVSPALKERTVRIALTPARQDDALFFFGSLSDAVAGRRTRVGPVIDAAVEPYWRDVRDILDGNPPMFALRALGSSQHAEAAAAGVAIAEGVAAVNVTEPPPLHAEAPPAVPRFPVGVLWGALLVGMLFVAGAGWSRAISYDRDEAVLLAPATGVAALMLFGLVASELGVRLAGPGGVLVFLLAASAGFAAALVRRARDNR